MTPVFYSFRRCPYAMRARLTLVSAQVPVCLREVVLKDKPQAFLNASPSGTVPCLVTDQGVIDESLDIMIWALKQNDPERLLDMPGTGWQLIETCDGPFKAALDRTKYATRYPESDQGVARAQAAEFLYALEAQLSESLFARQRWPIWRFYPLCGNSHSLINRGLMRRTGHGSSTGWRSFSQVAPFRRSCRNTRNGNRVMTLLVFHSAPLNARKPR